jgi:hypothetical protein
MDYSIDVLITDVDAKVEKPMSLRRRSISRHALSKTSALFPFRGFCGWSPLIGKEARLLVKTKRLLLFIARLCDGWMYCVRKLPNPRLDMAHKSSGLALRLLIES